MGFSYSEEQQAILDSQPGFNMVVANAGVGKTEISSEFIVRSYLKEQAILFPGKGHVTGDDQLKILKQFKVISFTVKAAGELTTRVYKKFGERGIPIPMQFGKPFPLSRTCDAYIQRWLTHPMVMPLWFEWDTRWRNSLEAIYKKLPSSAKQRVDQEAAKLKGDYTKLRALQKLWGPLIDGVAKDALLLAVCPRQALFTPGGSWVGAIRKAMDDHVSNLSGATPTPWAKPLFERVGVILTKARTPFDQKELDLEKQDLNKKVQLEAELRPWIKTRTLAYEVGGVYDFSRSIGFHPFYAPENAATRTMVDRLSACEFANFTNLQSICRELEDVKGVVGALDFGDYLQSAKTTFEKYSYLLEKKKEYPSYGLRGKYVIWDEAQDNSLWQYWLLNQLCGSAGSNFHCIVLGDPKQAIYSFRGGNADEFVRNVKFLKDHAPKHLYGLTTSYRSCKKIVAIGNQVGRMLPAGKVEAFDSKGVYHEEGEIVVAPPLKDMVEEFTYVKQKYKEIRQTLGPQSSIMLLVRSGIDRHPCTEWVDGLGDPNLCILTQHRSKGLEADHVFLLGCTAGRYPDTRSPIEDEINLFYVAVTRPRMVLYICAPVILVDDEGVEKYTGPSPFLHDTPMLKTLALSSGWTEEQLKKGVSGHKALVAMYGTKLKERRLSLLEEAKLLFPNVPEHNLSRRRSMDTGARWKRLYRDPDKMHISPKPFGT